MSKPDAFWDLSLGHILTGLGVFGSAFGVVLHFESTLATQGERIEAIVMNTTTWRREQVVIDANTSALLTSLQSQVSELRGSLQNRKQP